MSESRAASVLQMVLMAAIVATMLYWPIAVAVAALLHLFDISPDVLATFGGAVNRYVGLLAWWFVVFVPTLVYAGFVFPWEQ